MAVAPDHNQRSTLESFTIRGKLGAGAFAVVYKAVRHADGRTYALKELDLRGLSSTQQQDAIQETSVLASLDCPHIIKFHDSFLHEGKLYICMEYAPGGTLYDYIRTQPGPLPEAQTWKLLAQMLVGLNHMHERNVLHRDFKTLNVFLDAELNVRLGDLGVAKVLSTESAFAHTFIGTPYYLSPEMCEDRPYNAKSDVWALGVVLYECCTQRHPFDAQNQGSLMLKILRGRYPPLTGYSRELTEVVKACLTLDDSKRPDTNALLAMRCVRERAASAGVELPPPVEPLGRCLAASPSRRGIAAGRSFTSMRVRMLQQPAATDGDGSEQQQQQQPAVTVLTPAVVQMLPLDLPHAPAGVGGGSRGLAPRPPSRRALLSPREEAGGARQQAGAPPAGALVVGGAGRLAGSPSQRRPTADDAAAAVAGAVAVLPELHLQGLRLDAASGKSSPLPPGGGGAVDAPSGRMQGLLQALPAVRKQIMQQVVPLAFDRLRQLVSEAAHAGDAALETAASSIVPASQAAAVLPLLLKLAYLEAQLEDAALS